MELIGTTEIGRMLGVSRQRADQYTHMDGFPKPVSELAQGRIWRKSDFKRWLKKRDRILVTCTGCGDEMVIPRADVEEHGVKLERIRCLECGPANKS